MTPQMRYSIGQPQMTNYLGIILGVFVFDFGENGEFCDRYEFCNNGFEYKFDENFFIRKALFYCPTPYAPPNPTLLTKYPTNQTHHPRLQSPELDILGGEKNVLLSIFGFEKNLIYLLMYFQIHFHLVCDVFDVFCYLKASQLSWPSTKIDNVSHYDVKQTFLFFFFCLFFSSILALFCCFSFVLFFCIFAHVLSFRL